jgi:ATP-dependent Clp protease, protease subunit
MGAGYSVKARGNASAEIYIYEDVGESWFGGVTAKQFATDLKDLGAVQNIDVRINSAGGDVFDGLAIYRLLVDHPARVVAFVDGMAASIASVIAMAADEIRINAAGFIMVHDAWGVSIGNAAEMRQMADLLETTSGSITDVYVARTKNARTQVRAWMEDETWFTGAEAVEAGFAGVLDELKVAAHVDLSGKKFKRLPAALSAKAAPAVEPGDTVVRPRYQAATDTLTLMRARMRAAQGSRSA